ncbi:MAG: prepilin-type N-terminal cleavage/methylation domain-containing protein [Armatimonadota bacterium]
MFVRFKIKNTGGFTLVEIMVTMLILAMVGFSLTSLILHTLGAWSSGYDRNDTVTDADVLFQKLQLDVREASAATVAENELRLSIPPLITDSNGEKYYDLTATPTTYRYYLQNGKIYQQIGTSPARSFASCASDRGITFSVTGNTVTVNVHKSDNPEETIDSYQIVMRNFQGQE